MLERARATLPAEADADDVAVDSSNSALGGAKDADAQPPLSPAAAPAPAAAASGRVRHSYSSAYDFVKVRVWLGDGEERHATVLSRFLLVRTLTAAMASAQCTQHSCGWCWLRH